MTKIGGFTRLTPPDCPNTATFRWSDEDRKEG